ncbi:MAG TPA: hypothetical protein VE224_14750, partial [Pseudolabrys sp.]|nr:hypothetical protein [Pseudolabrys sp.]
MPPYLVTVANEPSFYPFSSCLVGTQRYTSTLAVPAVYVQRFSCAICRQDADLRFPGAQRSKVMMWRSRSGPHDDGAGDIRTGPDGAIALDERGLGERAGNAGTLGGGRFPLRFYRPMAAWLSDLSRRCAIRTQLLLILLGLMIAAWLIGGAITVLHARQSTRVEITAAMNLAEALVHEAAPMIEHSTAPERALAAIPAQVGSIRHVRISATDAAGLPL